MLTRTSHLHGDLASVSRKLGTVSKWYIVVCIRHTIVILHDFASVVYKCYIMYCEFLFIAIIKVAYYASSMHFIGIFVIHTER